MSLPDEPRGKSRRRCWFRPSSQSKFVTVRSKVGWMLGHWVNRGTRSARCPGEGCTVCASGKEPELFTYVMVEVDGGEILVWEIPHRLRDLAREIDSSEFEGVGLKLVVWREGVLKNSPISAQIIGQDDPSELDIDAFVATLGNEFDLRSTGQPSQSPFENTSHVSRVT